MLLTQMIERNAQVFNGQTALVHGQRSQTWGQLKTRIATMAGAMHTNGVSSGDRVAILALNSDRYFEAFFATLWLGAVIVPLNARWSAQENKYALDDSQASTLIVDDVFMEAAVGLSDICEGLNTLLSIGDGPCSAGVLNMEAQIINAKPVSKERVEQNELAGIFYTGGTTGFPKGVMLSSFNLWSSAMATVVGFNLNVASIRFLHVAPMFHIAGIASFLGCALVGASQYCIPAFVPEQVMEVIERHDISHTLLVPTMIGMLLHHEQFDSKRLSSLKQIIYGASPMPESTLSQVMQQLPQVAFYQGYGQTELAPSISILGPQEHANKNKAQDKTRSAGRVCHTVELEIRGQDGQTLPAGEVGEVAVAGANVMMGYLNKPQQTQETIVDGWVLTGDAGYLDSDGYLFLVDRVKDMIVTGAENVYSAEVESVISTHPSVVAVAVIGIPSQQWGEAVHAVVVCDEPLSEADIIEHCKAKIAGYKCPKSVAFQHTDLPMSAAGKILKNQLRKPYWQGERLVN